MNGISILIPTYNYCCVGLARTLQAQAIRLDIAYEIIVADDGSNTQETIQANKVISKIPHCQFIQREQNCGRAVIRNFLAQQARYDRLLYLDSDAKVCQDDFLKRYLQYDSPVVDGGVTIAYNDSMKHNLRYNYEFANKDYHTAKKRQTRPYQHFRTTNFMVDRTIMTTFPFDERYRYYGYEDVAFGKVLQENNIVILHIDNPIWMEGLESNHDFVKKTEEGLRTLYEFRHELQDYSRLLQTIKSLPRPVSWLILSWHRLFGTWERCHLMGNHPWLRLFNFYKMGYYLNYTHGQSSTAKTYS